MFGLECFIQLLSINVTYNCIYFPGQEEVLTWVEDTSDRIVGNPAADFETRIRAEFGGMPGPGVKATHMRSVGSQGKPLAFDQENKKPPKTKRPHIDK